MPPKTVSIIVPTYNQAQYLAVCLDSIWFQDYPDLEIILVNDGSTDGTAGVIAAFERALAEDTVSFASYYDTQGSTDCSATEQGGTTSVGSL